MRQSSYVDQEQSAKEPNVVPQPPILETIFFADDLHGWAAGDGGNVVRTRDGGQTWTVSKINFPLYLQGIFFHNKWDGWMIGNVQGGGVILKTEDGGENWRVQAKVEGFELSAVHSIWFADEQHGWVVGQNSEPQGVILATQDGGVHWHPQYFGKDRSSELNVVKFTDSQHGWAAGHNIILYTENGGQQWREQRYVQGEYFFDIELINSTECWVVGSSGLLIRTTDRGNTWQAHQLPTKYQNLWLASVRFIDSVHGWVAGDDGAIFSTNDGGQTWTLESIKMSEYLRDLALTSRSIFAVGNGGMILRRQI
jgi:photosystem II stability/assembly factor-like uncharacterized protein